MICLAIQVPQLLVTVILLWQCISNANALQCFICDSSINPGCTDLKSNSSIVPEECSLDKMRSIESWLFGLNKISYFKTGEYKEPLMYCQKVVAKDPNTNTLITARFCQIHLSESNPCAVLKNKLKSFISSGSASSAQHGDYGKGDDDNKKDEFFCSYCDKDLCNGSTFNKWTNSLLLLVISIVLLPSALHKHTFW